MQVRNIYNLLTRPVARACCEKVRYVGSCELVTDSEPLAAQINDQHLKAVYLRIAHQWSVLARSYEFADSAEHFLLDAKRTKDASSERPSGELVHLPSSPAKSHDRCCLRLVPDEPPAESGAAAA